MAFSSPDQQRAILSLSFEQALDGFIYYPNAWSGGVPVTAEEREAYLNTPMIGSRREWRKSIEGRQTLPRRPYWPTLLKILAVMPMSMTIFGLAFGAIITLLGFNAENRLAGAAYVTGGSALMIFGLSIVVARIFARRS
ncbi:hypothetical protein [Sphingomonas sp. MM-1]|uniref:hypothetical protein n=1 Tax=Sphingomonas sp. MM-1 TaxID=745310 RepID=UPI0011823AA8|nr:MULTISPECIES: hypothetical protein [unclassified Sphingomonas]MDX3885275.1 hypothetical protein [Sphingomonas sp.]